MVVKDAVRSRKIKKIAPFLAYNQISIRHSGEEINKMLEIQYERKKLVGEPKRVRKDCINLWRDCFQDSEQYMEYYFSEKVKNNIVYELSEEHHIVSMLHLNPYGMCVKGRKELANYIVGVATEEAYRKRGYMKELLHWSLNELYREGQLFTYLMPAAQAIYSPHGFRTIYEQRRYKGVWKEQRVVDTSYKAVIWDELSILQKEEAYVFANKLLTQEFEVVTERSLAYYERLSKEMQATGGHVVCILREGIITAIIPYMYDTGVIEIVEVLTETGRTKKVMESFCRYLEYQRQLRGVKVYFLESYFLEESLLQEVVTIQEKANQPIIMARVVNLKESLTYLERKEMEFNESIKLVIQITDSIIKENNKIIEIQIKEGKIFYHDSLQEPEIVIEISDWTSWFFGYKSVQEICKEQQRKVPEVVQKKWNQLRGITSCYINEIV